MLCPFSFLLLLPHNAVFAESIRYKPTKDGQPYPASLHLQFTSTSHLKTAVAIARSGGLDTIVSVIDRTAVIGSWEALHYNYPFPLSPSPIWYPALSLRSAAYLQGKLGMGYLIDNVTDILPF
jgi:hypothetical protein